MHNGYFRKLKYTFFSGNTTASRRIVRSFGRKRTAQYGSKRPDNCNFTFISIKVSVYGKESFRKIFNPAADKNSFFCNCFPKSPKERTDPDNDMTTKTDLVRRIVSLAFMLPILCACGRKWTVEPHDTYCLIRQDGGQTLGYFPGSGVRILYSDGYAFKDLNRKNGRKTLQSDSPSKRLPD